MKVKWGYVSVIGAVIASYGAYKTVSRVLGERRRYDRVTADRIRGLS